IARTGRIWRQVSRRRCEGRHFAITGQRNLGVSKTAVSVRFQTLGGLRNEYSGGRASLHAKTRVAHKCVGKVVRAVSSQIPSPGVPANEPAGRVDRRQEAVVVTGRLINANTNERIRSHTCHECTEARIAHEDLLLAVEHWTSVQEIRG